ncbi:DUF4382 domain-containing protein [Sulfurovum sp.]|uniref:DUF4382 domain-containing protein n=1 Tax=Sulfurovum sp. TaxID=1969726 RepID=UPI0025D2F12C|nr:DUF4382 domain-containing protein [Sulfurovum sp.]
MKYLIALFFALLTTLIVGCGGSDTTAISNTGKTGTLALKLKDAPGDYEAVYVTIKEVQVHLSGDIQEEDNETDAGDNIIEENNTSTISENNATSDETVTDIVENDVNEDQNDTLDEEGWKVVAAPHKTFDLLELQNGVEAVLGEENLTVGHYTQMRLILDTQADDSNNTRDEAHPYGNYILKEGDDTPHALTVPSAMQTGIKLIKGFDIEENATTTLTLDFDAKKSIHQAGQSGKWMMKPTIKIIQE